MMSNVVTIDAVKNTRRMTTMNLVVIGHNATVKSQALRSTLGERVCTP